MDNLKFRWSDIEPLCLIRNVLANFWMVVVSAIVGFLAAYVLMDVVYQPQYRGDVTFVVTSRTSVYASSLDMSAASNVAETLSGLLSSDLMRAKVAQTVGLEDFDGSIAAKNSEGTNLVFLTVQTHSARKTFLMVNALVNHHNIITETVLDKAIITTLDAPVISEVSTMPMAKWKAEVLGAGAMALLMIAILCALSIGKDTVQNESSGREKLDAPFIHTVHYARAPLNLKTAIGWVLEAMRLKKGERRRDRRPLIIDPLSGFRFIEEVHYIRSQFEQKKTDDKNVFLITSVSPAEGKSLLSENIALSLAQKHENVVLFDCDLRKPSHYRNFAKTEDSGWKLVRTFQVKSFRLEMIYSRHRNLYVVYCPELPDNPLEILGSRQFLSILTSAKKNAKYVLIDSSPLEYFSDGEQLADFADFSMLVVRQDFVPAPIINDAIDTMRSQDAAFMGYALNGVESIVHETSGYGDNKLGKYGKYGKYGYGKYEKGGIEKMDFSDLAEKIQMADEENKEKEGEKV